MQPDDDKTQAVTVLTKGTVIRNKNTVLTLDEHLCIVIPEMIDLVNGSEWVSSDSPPF